MKITPKIVIDPRQYVIIERNLREQVMSKIEGVAKKVAAKMEQDSAGEVKPEIIKYDYKKDQKTAVNISINKPKEIEVAEKLNLIKRSWNTLPTLLKD